MATLPLDQHVQWRGGTTTAINGFAGAAREVVVDTTKQTLVILSGTAGTNYPVAKESRAITAGSGIDLTVGGSAASSATLASDFTVSVDPSDLYEANGGLGVDTTSGKLKSVFSISYTAATGVFNVLGEDGTTVLATATLPSHLSVLKSVTLETASTASPVNSQTSGTFIHFVFTLSTGADSDIFLNVTDLIDVYTAGDGLELNNGQFSAKLGNGLEFNSTTKAIQAKVKSGEAILVSDNDGLHIDTTALTTATGQTIVSADTGNVISASATDGGAFLKLASGGMLGVNANGELEAVLDFGVITE